MIRIESPCHGCTERHFLCHGTCEKYKAYCTEVEERKACLKRLQEVETAQAAATMRMAKETKKGQTKHTPGYYYQKYHR